MLDALGPARILDARGEPPSYAKALLDITHHQQAAIGREGFAVEADDDWLASDW